MIEVDNGSNFYRNTDNPGMVSMPAITFFNNINLITEYTNWMYSAIFIRYK